MTEASRNATSRSPSVAEILIEEHNKGCEAACEAQRPNERQSGGCGYQRHDGSKIYSRRCPTCPKDWKIDVSRMVSAVSATGIEREVSEIIMGWHNEDEAAHCRMLQAIEDLLGAPITQKPGELATAQADTLGSGLTGRRDGPSAISHTDHPLRHWDRTCPACVGDKGVADMNYALKQDRQAAVSPRSTVAATDHKQGCPALGGYGTADRECICKPLSSTAASSLADELHAMGDAAYCRASDLSKRDLCLGEEHKLNSGAFTIDNLKALEEVRGEFGRAAGLWEAAKHVRRIASATTSTKKIPAIGLLKEMGKQRDECADALRELVLCMKNQPNSTHPYELVNAEKALKSVPTYRQRLQNIAEGIGMTYDELMTAMDARADSDGVQKEKL